MSNISGLEIKLCDFWLRDLVMRSHDLMISCKIRSIYREGEGEKQFAWKTFISRFPLKGQEQWALAIRSVDYSQLPFI